MSDLRNGSNKNNTDENPDVNYWQSFQELYNNSDFIKSNENEFKLNNPDEFDSSEMSTLSRRKFLALLGASAALAGTACTDYRDKGEIIPYNNKPEEITIGRPNFYASTCNLCANACGTLIKTREGRPVKIDGNPDHPVSNGKICAQGQAGIMGLYDPDRLKNPKRKSGNSFVDYNWKDVDSDIILDLMNAGDSEIAILTHTITSPTTKKVLDEFTKAYPSARVYSYEQFDNSARNKAWQKCYGSGSFPALRWDKANVILSVDGDFLGASDNKIENIRLFSDGREVNKKKFNRLYTIEGNLSLTGMNSDYRLRLRSDAQYAFILSLIDELNKKGITNIALPSNTKPLDGFAKEFNLNEETLNYLVKDLAENKGGSIIYAGDHLPVEAHIAVNLLNNALGNEAVYNSESEKYTIHPLSTLNELSLLAGRISSGEVSTVIHINCNPVYHLPENLNYAGALSKAETVISLVETENETSSLSKFVLPIHNQLESWGDAKTRKGFYSLQQPVISPLYNSRQTEAILLTWAEGFTEAYKETIYHTFLMKNWEDTVYPSLNHKLPFKQFWYGALHDGVVYSDEKPNGIGSINNSVAANLKPAGSLKDFVLVLKESYSLKDGRFANNGWLQELPHPVSKITWDNYAAISPATAKGLGLNNSDMAEITVAENSVKIPVLIQPGAADNTITIELGYGRTKGGTVGTGVGFNANKLINSSEGKTAMLYSGVQINKTTGDYKLVTAQTIYAFNTGIKKDLPEKRGIIKEGTVNQYLNNPKFIHEGEHHNLESVNPPIEYPGIKWGMSVDMNKCTGCSECVVACNVENNIPVVGKEQVAVGREMHWLRVDRYYSGTPEEPEVSTQLMLCQHCDQAPCENVCPVAATTHSPDGLNQMVYNRCVGTRYCSNNCPYKVRRFNYFNFRDHFRDGYQESPVFALLQNPEVTVRSRGVMEKCTFCIQRIMDARQEATKESREVKGSDVVTACQQACGTNAIKFGDINNKEEEFYSYRNHELGYHVLDELNVIPNVTYIAKLKNTHGEEA